MWKYSLFLSDFNKIWIFPMNIRKTPKYHLSLKSVNWKSSCVIRTTDGRTDMAKPTVVLRNVANAPKTCRTSTQFNPICKTPTICTYTIKYMYYNRYFPTCFGVYCAIFRENFCLMLKTMLQYLIKDLKEHYVWVYNFKMLLSIYTVL